ncbi:MAG: AraC family transcriptional regulator [Spirochaetaceae bacterium]|nr:MAG: AraC family transcriptional regulator [Spirochaetaceae bacterium]
MEVGKNEFRTIYRTVATRGKTSRWGYGHVAKPDRSSNYTERASDDLIIVYVVRGTGYFADGHGAVRNVSAGDVLVHWPLRACSLAPEPDGQWIEYWILADRTFSNAMARLRLVSPHRSVISIGVDPGIEGLFSAIGESLRAMDDHDVDLLSLRLHALLVELNRRERRFGVGDAESSLVSDACRRLAETVDDPISIPVLARSLGVGYERFRKVFRRHVGLAPAEYRVHRRVDRARELIVQNKLTNREIADTLGYADQFTFSKQFKRVVGESPAAFRRRMG